MVTVTNPLFSRWYADMRQRVPQMPEEVFEVYYQSMDAGISLSMDELTNALHGDVDEAAHWHSVALVWLLDPRLYTPLFEAEDEMADCRAKRTAFVDECKHIEEQLAELDRQIAGHKAYGLLSPDHQAQVQPLIEALDSQREALLRHQSRDLPAVQALLEDEERAVRQRLQGAQLAIAEAWEAQIDTVQAGWTAEALEKTEPVLEVLQRARTLDAAAQALGRQAHLSGSLALRHAVVQRVQGQG